MKACFDVQMQIQASLNWSKRSSPKRPGQHGIRYRQIAGTRELIPHESYRLVYEVQADAVWILALVHTARLWPPTRP